MTSSTREDLVATAAEYGAEPSDVEAVLAGQRVADASAYRAAEVLRCRQPPPVSVANVRRRSRYKGAAGRLDLQAIAAGASRVLAAIGGPQ